MSTALTTPCIEFQGYKMPEGYGQINRDGRVQLAHRYALEQKLRRPLGEGMQANHRCDNRACWNPDHLYEGSQADNIHDAMARGRHVPPPVRFGERHHKAALTDSQVKELRRLRSDGWLLRELAARYGTTETTVSRIARGLSRRG